MPALLPPKQNIVGIGISSTSYEEVVELCRDWALGRQAWLQEGADSSAAPSGRYVTVTSVHGIIHSVLDRTFRPFLNEADLATPDGMPVVWALRSFGRKNQGRVYGPNLTIELCRMAAIYGVRVYLYGSSEEVLDQLARNLQRMCPALQIVGSYSPPFRPLTTEESDEIVQTIRKSNADLVFVGLSTPKQEAWMHAHTKRLPGIILVGVGAAFDFHAGLLRQAPPWMQASGLEWLFRLSVEPGRLWKRYLLITPLFIPLWALQKVGLLRFFLPFDAEGHPAGSQPS